MVSSQLKNYIKQGNKPTAATAILMVNLLIIRTFYDS